MFGQVPALKIEYNDPSKDNVFLTQSTAILRFIAKIAPKSKLIPECPIKAATVDAICDHEKDAFAAIRCFLYQERNGFDKIDAKTMEICKKEINEKVIPKHLKMLEDYIQEFETGWLAGTENPTIADFQWAVWLRIVELGWTGQKIQLPERLDDLVERFFDLDENQSWYDDHDFKLWF